jgi:hypothetical protein
LETLPSSVRPTPQSEKAPAPALNVRPETAVPVSSVLVLVSFTLPPKTSTSPAAG